MAEEDSVKKQTSEFLAIAAGITQNFTPADPDLYKRLQRTLKHESFSHLSAWTKWSTMINLLAGSLNAASENMDTPEHKDQFWIAAPTAVSLKLAEFMRYAKERE